MSILNFDEYVANKHADLQVRYGLTDGDVQQEAPAAIYWQEWRDYVVRRFNEGGSIFEEDWREFDDALRGRVLRTHRALSNDSLTHALCAVLDGCR